MWNELFGERVWCKYPSEHLVRFVCGNRIKGRALEIGCGIGANLWFMAKEGLFVDGLDGSISALNQTKSLMNEFNVSYGELINADFTKYDYNKKYDIIVDVEALYCVSLEEAKKTVNSLYEALNKGGKLFSQTFAYSVELFNGELVGHNAYLSETGALAGKGYSRYSNIEDIHSVYGCFDSIEIEKVSRNSGEIQEWIIVCSKL